MIYELEKVGFFKRLSAYLLDGILTVILAIGVALLLSGTMNYNEYNAKVTEAYEKYEAQYNTSFQVTEQEYSAWTEEQKQALEDASDALLADEDAMYNYHMTVNIIMVITSASIILSLLVVELLVPLLLKNGQTLGKKVFGLCVVRTDCVRITGLQLAMRTILGKIVIETMVPVYLLLMLIFGIVGMPATVIMAGVFIGQGVSLVFTSRNAAIHDLVAGTAVADIHSQLIFDTTEEKIAFQKKVHTERTARTDD